jgi:hypothetical protein
VEMASTVNVGLEDEEQGFRCRFLVG